LLVSSGFVSPGIDSADGVEVAFVPTVVVGVVSVAIAVVSAASVSVAVVSVADPAVPVGVSRIVSVADESVDPAVV